MNALSINIQIKKQFKFKLRRILKLSSFKYESSYFNKWKDFANYKSVLDLKTTICKLKNLIQDSKIEQEQLIQNNLINTHSQEMLILKEKSSSSIIVLNLLKRVYRKTLDYSFKKWINKHRLKSILNFKIRFLIMNKQNRQISYMFVKWKSYWETTTIFIEETNLSNQTSIWNELARRNKESINILSNSFDDAKHDLKNKEQSRNMMASYWLNLIQTTLMKFLDNTKQIISIK